MYNYNVTVDVRVSVTVPVTAVHLESACETAEMRVADAIQDALHHLRLEARAEVNIVGANPEKVARAYKTGGLYP